MDSPPPAGVVELDDQTGAMSVEQYLKHVLEVLTEKAREYTDDAIDELADVYKQHREEIRNLQHQKKTEQAAKNKAGAWRAAVAIRDRQYPTSREAGTSTSHTARLGCAQARRRYST